MIYDNKWYIMIYDIWYTHIYHHDISYVTQSSQDRQRVPAPWRHLHLQELGGILGSSELPMGTSGVFSFLNWYVLSIHIHLYVWCIYVNIYIYKSISIYTYTYAFICNIYVDIMCIYIYIYVLYQVHTVVLSKTIWGAAQKLIIEDHRATSFSYSPHALPILVRYRLFLRFSNINAHKHPWTVTNSQGPRWSDRIPGDPPGSSGSHRSHLQHSQSFRALTLTADRIDREKQHHVDGLLRANPANLATELLQCGLIKG